MCITKNTVKTKHKTLIKSTTNQLGRQANKNNTSNNKNSNKNTNTTTTTTLRAATSTTTTSDNATLTATRTTRAATLRQIKQIRTKTKIWKNKGHRSKHVVLWLHSVGCTPHASLVSLTNGGRQLHHGGAPLCSGNRQKNRLGWACHTVLKHIFHTKKCL